MENDVAMFFVRFEFAQVGVVGDATLLPTASSRHASASIVVAPLPRVAQPARLTTRQRPLATPARTTCCCRCEW